MHAQNIFIVVLSKNNGLCSSLLPAKLKIVNYQNCIIDHCQYNYGINTYAAKQYCFFPYSIHASLSVPFRIKCCCCNTIDFTLVSLKNNYTPFKTHTAICDTIKSSLLFSPVAPFDFGLPPLNFTFHNASPRNHNCVNLPPPPWPES